MKMQHKTTTLRHSIRLIAMASGLLCSPAFAMQALEDEHLENVTGEGIAFVLGDFSLRWNGADGNNDGQGTYGTGYMRIIPVGPLSNIITQHNNATANPSGSEIEKKRAAYDVDIGKGDVFLYGLSISENDGDVSTQFSGNSLNIGTPQNPWLFVTKTINVPNFKGEPKDLAYLGFEAPELKSLLTQSTDINSNGQYVGTDPNPADTYDLKLGLWADAFVRDPSKVEGDEAEFWLNSETDGKRPLSPTDSTLVDRENRLRLQAIMNGISLYGTNLKIFQTLDGAESAEGLGGTYQYYNNTFGLALTARINSGDSTSVRAPVYSEAPESDITTENTEIIRDWELLHGGWNSTLSQSQTTGNCNNGGSVTVTINFSQTGCQFMVQDRIRSDTKTRTVTRSGSWTAASGLNDHVIRLSTRETEDSPNAANVLYSPATTVGTNHPMPEFADKEGIFLYKPNINLVLGTEWQPIVFGVAPDGNNLSIEITRIPNVANVYKEIYTDYTGVDSSYKGGTCSIYWCGGDGNGISKNATHSSITIGSTLVTAPTTTIPLQLNAYTGADALGISFGDLMAVQGTNPTTSEVITSDPVEVTQARWIERTQATDLTWEYRKYTCLVVLTCTNTGTLQEWAYNEVRVGAVTGRTNATGSNPRFSYPVASGNGNTWTNNATSGGLCGNSDCTYYGTINNRNWTLADTKGLTFSTAHNPVLNPWLDGQGSAARTDVSTNQAITPTKPVVASPMSAVNLGSAVIDGLLIQHFKLTTKGL